MLCSARINSKQHQLSKGPPQRTVPLWGFEIESTVHPHAFHMLCTYLHIYTSNINIHICMYMWVVSIYNPTLPTSLLPESWMTGLTAVIIILLLFADVCPGEFVSDGAQNVNIIKLTTTITNGYNLWTGVGCCWVGVGSWLVQHYSGKLQ